MNISEKIADIRRQPENIRLRYVWGCVAISMFFIVLIWVLSLTSLFQKNSNIDDKDSVTDLKNQLQNINKQAPSLKDFSQTPLTVESEGVQTSTDSEFEYPVIPNQEEIPQSASYSN